MIYKNNIKKISLVLIMFLFNSSLESMERMKGYGNNIIDYSKRAWNGGKDIVSKNWSKIPPKYRYVFDGVLALGAISSVGYGAHKIYKKRDIIKQNFKKWSNDTKNLNKILQTEILKYSLEIENISKKSLNIKSEDIGKKLIEINNLIKTCKNQDFVNQFNLIKNAYKIIYMCTFPDEYKKLNIN